MAKITRICPVCQKEFPVKSTQPKQKYCGRVCQAISTSNHFQGPDAGFWAKVNKVGPDDCWEWQNYLNDSGYGIFSWHDKNIFAHRFSYTLHKGEIPKEMCVCHTCDNRKCVNPNHLWLGTKGDNNRDCVRKGRRSKPEITTRLEIGNEIRRQYATGNFTQEQLASSFGFSQSTISRFVLNQA